MSTARIPSEWKKWFPDEMLGLPEPWRELENDYEWLATIPHTPEEMIKALKVLEYGFRVLPKLPRPSFEEVLPERITEFPTVAVGGITLRIPTFDDFRRDPFVEALNVYKHDYPPQHVELLAQIWVEREVTSLVARVHNWIFQTLHEMRDPELVTSYISLVRHVWQTLSEEMLGHLITRSYRTALDASIPQTAILFLDEVLAAPNIDPENRAWANKLCQELQDDSATTKE